MKDPRDWILADDPRRPALVAALVGVLVYVNALRLGFAWDDVDIIQGNAALHGWRTLAASVLEPYWPGQYGAAAGLWRPLSTTWWGAQWMVWGDSPAPFHAMGVLLHAASCFVLVLVLDRLLDRRAAILGGLVFAVHPVHVEAVANVVGNADVIATLMVLAALLLHLRGRGTPGWRRSLAIGGLFALGVLAKEIAITLPALIFLVDAARADIGLRELRAYLAARWRLYSVLVVTLALLLAARLSVLGAMTPPQAPVGALLLGEISRVWTVPAIWLHYVRLMLFPLDLSADYGGIIPVRTGWSAESLGGALAAITILGVAWWAWRTGGPLRKEAAGTERRVLGFGVVWFMLAVLPVSNVLFLSGVLVAERNLYLASVGAAAALGWALAELMSRRALAYRVVIGAALVLLAVRTITYTPVWKDTRALFAELIERHPEVGHAWFFRGDALWREGRQPEARQAFSTYLLRTDSEPVLATQAASRLSAMDRASPRAAQFLLERSWRDRPDLATAPSLLAIHHLNHGQFREGEAAARAAVGLSPENADMARVLAALLSGQGRHAEAIPFRLRSIELGGGAPYQVWLFLSGDYATVGDTAAAIAALDSARVRAPGLDVSAQIDQRKRLLAGR